MSKAIDRVFKYLEKKGVKHTRFEKEIGLSNGYLNTQLKRKADLGEKVFNKIIDNSLDLNPVWLITGNGEMFIDNSPKNRLLEINALNGEGVVVPVYNVDAYAGDSLSFFGNAQYIEKYYRVPFAKEGDISLSVIGNSMYPHIHSGDVVVIRQLNNWKEWVSYGKFYVIVTEEQLLIKIIRKSRKNPDDYYNIYSVNSAEYDDFEMPKSDIIQIFLVIGIVGKRAF